MTLVKELTTDEEDAIEELQTRMKKSLTPKLAEDPTLFYRFLKARDFDVDKAEKMLMKHITWRKVHQVDTLYKDFKPKEFFFKYILPSIIGVDKEGDLVVYAPSGKSVTADALKCCTMNEYKKSFVWFAERNVISQKEQSQKTGKECEQMLGIMDLNGLTFSNATDKKSAEVMLHILCGGQDNYPERLKSIYVINAPAYYVLTYSILKAFISKETVEKFHVFGNNGWKEKLLSEIDADVLPAFLGGNRTDPDGNPLCLTFVNHGGKIPSHYYLSNKDRYFRDVSKVKRITVPHSEKKEICLDVTEKGSIIRWEYFVKSNDIGFGLSFQETDQSTREEIIPVQKYSTSDGTEIGFYNTQSIGKYIIIFDNSHSWINSKEVEYYLTVTNKIE